MNNTTVVSNATGTGTTTEIDMDIGFNIYYYGLLFSLTLINIPANILVITTILRHRQLRQPANYFLASLAVSDLVMGCVCPVYNLSHLEIPAISGSLGKYSVTKAHTILENRTSQYSTVQYVFVRYVLNRIVFFSVPNE